MRETQADQRSPHRRVAMRRPLTLQIWKKRHAACARRNGVRFGVESLVRLSCAGEVAREMVAIPRERAAGREHNAHEIPDVRCDVAERVRAETRIDARLQRRREYRTR